MKYTYPAIFRPEGNSYYVFFPDITDGATNGDSINECIEMASDWLSGALYMREKSGENIPAPTDILKVEKQEGDIVTLILADTSAYALAYENRAIKKTLTLPYKLNDQAEKIGLNFSQALREIVESKIKEHHQHTL